MCSGIRAEKLGPRFLFLSLKEKHDCADASSSTDSPNGETHSQVIAGRWERSPLKQEAHFSTGDVNWTFLHFFQSVSVLIF